MRPKSVRRSVTLALAVAVAVPLLPAVPAVAATGVSVVELDLVGVQAAAIGRLPAAMPVPAEEAEQGSTRPDRLLRRPAPQVLTAELDVAPFSVMGVTWDAGSAEDVTVAYRVRQDGVWSPWTAVGATDVAPDANGPEAGSGERTGTDPLIALDADGLQVWAEAATGTVTGLKAMLIDSGTLPTDAAPVTRTARTTATTTTLASTAPALITRAGWGADESRVTCQADLTTEWVSAAVHHTAGTNVYQPEDVPGILRDILIYHTTPESQGGRGWCDIGYNFLVDKFGRVFEGRAGSIDQAVVGVHTGGFNSRTIGVAAIGTYGDSAPGALINAIADVIAWKFTQYRIYAGASVEMISGGGASRYPAGTKVTFPTIYGHRDAQQTSCPGQALYNALGLIRQRVGALANQATDATPVGTTELISRSGIGVRVKGWALDLGTTQALQIRVTAGGTVHSVTASLPRPDVAAKHPAEGANHGFDTTIALPNGRHAVCLTAMNTGAGVDRHLGCARVTVDNTAPRGAVDVASGGVDRITVSGWALDQDSTASIPVHVYLNGAFARAVTASSPRPDVGAAYGTSGAHGYDLTIPAALGRHTVCVYAINTPAGPNPQLGCRTVDVANTAPVGSLDLARGQTGGIAVGGWALDKDSPSPIAVHLYLDGKAVRGVTASAPRPDVAAAYGTSGTHGYSAVLPATIGRHTVCAYAINTPTGPNPLLGCRDVEVPNTAPIGNLETVTGTAGTITVGGWTLDKDTTTPLTVHLYLDGTAARAVTAATPRPDVAAAYGTTGTHGFRTDLTATTGNHTVCAYAINTPAGPNPQLGCRTVTVP